MDILFPSLWVITRCTTLLYFPFVITCFYQKHQAVQLLDNFFAFFPPSYSIPCHLSFQYDKELNKEQQCVLSIKVFTLSRWVLFYVNKHNICLQCQLMYCSLYVIKPTWFEIWVKWKIIILRKCMCMCVCLFVNIEKQYTSSWSPRLMTMEWRIGGTSIQWPSLRSCNPLTLWSWNSRMMPPASVWALRPFMSSGLGQGG